jgi:glutaconate CoA-transferase subunit A
MHACHAIAQITGVERLYVVDLFGGLNVDWLVAAERVATVRASFVSLELFGLAPMFRQSAESGALTFIEESELSLIQALRASAMNLPFMPVPHFIGTCAYDNHPEATSIDCPFTGGRFAAVKPLSLDVTVVHALEADEVGNAVLPASRGFELEACAVSSHVIVTAERVVERGRLSRPADLPGAFVASVVETPHGAWPGGCPPLYGPDLDYLADYAQRPGDLSQATKRSPW